MMRSLMFNLCFSMWLASAAWAHTLKTVNAGGGADYTSMFDAVASLPNPFAVDYEISASGATDDTTPTTIVVTQAGYELYIHGDNASGTFDESKYQMRLAAAYTTAITVTAPTDKLIIERVQFTGIGTSYTGILVTTATGSIVTRRNLFQNFTQASYGKGIYFYGTGDIYTGRVAYNNIAWNCDQGYCVWQCQGDFYNNTASGCAYGLYIQEIASTNTICKNNLLSGSTTADYHRQVGGSGTVITAKNYTSDATSPDAGCANATITFVNPGGENFHLDNSMLCTLLGESAGGIFTTDVDADPRLNWYAGADELPGGACVTGGGFDVFNSFFGGIIQ